MSSMQQILAHYGLTADMARDWITSNLGNPHVIYNATKSIGLNNNMLAEILAPGLPGLTGSMIDSYFSGNGITTAQSIVQKFNLTTAQVGEWLHANYYSNPANVQEIAKLAGLDSIMLSELLSPHISGITPDAINQYLQQQIPPTPSPIPHPTRPVMSDDAAAQIAALVGPNQNHGILSTDYLRSQILQQGIGQEQYNRLYDPSQYIGHEDGVFTPQELGFDHLGNLSATSQTLESLFYGTLINTLRAIDHREAAQLDRFVEKNYNQLIPGTDTFEEFIAMTLNMFSTPATQPFLNDHDISESIVESASMVIDLMGLHGDMALMDGIFGGMLP